MTRSMHTGFEWVVDLYPVAGAVPGYRVYQFTIGPGPYGNWSYDGEWSSDVIDQFGNELSVCL